MAKPSVLKCIFYTRDVCGLDILYDCRTIKCRAIKRSSSPNSGRVMCRYTIVLPVAEKASSPDLNVGWTPFYMRSGRAAAR
jgi:hypothetical protein